MKKSEAKKLVANNPERAAEILVAASKLLSASWNPLKRNDVEWTPKFVESRNALHTLLNKLEQTP